MRLAGGAVAMAVAAGFSAAAARALARWVWPEADREARWVTGILFFTVLQSLVILGAGLVGGISPVPLFLVSAAGWGALAASRSLPGWPASWKLRWPEGAAERLLVVGGILLALSLPVKSVVFPPYIGDALSYHLPNVAEWIQARRLVYGFSPDSRLWFPMGFELVETWWAAFLGRDWLLGMAGMQMLALAVLSVGALARALDLRPAVAMLVYAFIPLVVLHSTSCCTDLASGAMVLAAYALVAARAPVPLAALPLCVGAGIKPTAIFGAVGVIAFWAVTRGGRPGGRPWGPAAAALGAGVVLGGFWYARNWILMGHPLYPVYGGPLGEALRADPVENLDTLRRTLVEFPARAVDPRPFSVMSPDTTSWGWFVLPWGLPLTLGALRGHARLRTLAVCFAAGWGVTIAMAPLNQLNLRFALWAPALFALGAAATPGRAVVWVAAAAAAINFLSTLVPGEVHNADRFRLPPAVPRSEPIACITSGDSPSYLYYNSDFSRPVRYPRSWEELRSSGVRYAVVVARPGWMRDLGAWKKIRGNVYELP